jgi:DMSO/TMAO reductase YedYZ molybdopterin-dependent catalytic subunit
MDRRHGGRTNGEIDRRLFLGGTAGMIPLLSPAVSHGGLAADHGGGERTTEGWPAPSRIARQRNPDNLEFPFPALESFLTPNHLFYVRSHFAVPTLDAGSWRLKIEGAVKKPMEIGYDELRKLPAHTLTALLECSGNGRVFLKPPQVGIRWELGGVSNAEWTGVRLADVLERAGLREDAVEVILEGADKGAYADPLPKTPGVIHYSRSLPLKKARRPEVLLAYQMNGKDLPAAHGFPVRAIVAGWYGMASVKWLQRIIVADAPFRGYFQTFMYTIWERTKGEPTLVPVTDIQVKSQIARPTSQERIQAGTKYRIFGAAWAGEPGIRKVEVSTDEGKTWAEATLLGKDVPYSWRFWEHIWPTPDRPGRHVLMARATDARGRVQPLKRDDDRRDAVISHVLPVEVEIGA